MHNSPSVVIRWDEKAPGQFISEGRVYGGGLHKVEPKELAQIPARAVLERIVGLVSIERQVKLFA